MEQNNIIKMRSLTEAMRVREMLLRKGIRASLIRTPGLENGCGYSLRIGSDIRRAREIVRNFRTGGDT